MVSLSIGTLSSLVSLISLLFASSASANDLVHDGAHLAGRGTSDHHRHVANGLVKRRGVAKRCNASPRTSKTASSAPSPTGSGSGSGSGSSTSGGRSGLIQVTGPCGANGATSKVSTSSGPNGSQDWLNCGLLKSGGWTPPDIQLSDLVVVDLDVALKSGDTFKACKPYLDDFNAAATKYKIPPIMIAAIAMQESSCDKTTVGGGGEQGLMQITADKCPGGKKGAACMETSYNIDAGAKYLASQLKDAKGNVLLAIGTYNGWSKGLTQAKATKAAHSKCCTCQNNLDYLMQYFNGWMLNIDPYQKGLGKYQNLAVCGDN